MPLHKDLTGSDLHEPKGVEASSNGTVYVSDGVGSGAWTKVGVGSIDTTSLKNANREMIFMAYTDIGTAGSRFMGLTRACKITKVLVTPQIPTAGADTVITIRNDAGTSMGTILITNGAAAGTIFSLTPVANNTFVANTKFQIDSDGGASNNANAIFTIELEWV